MASWLEHTQDAAAGGLSSPTSSRCRTGAPAAVRWSRRRADGEVPLELVLELEGLGDLLLVHERIEAQDLVHRVSIGLEGAECACLEPGGCDVGRAGQASRDDAETRAR